MVKQVFFMVAGIALAINANAQSPSEEVLVLINDNSLASMNIGEDYVTERNVPADHICHVRAPAARHMSFDDYRELRDFIITDCICGLIDEALRPPACAAPTQTDIQGSIADFIPNTPIRFFVTTQGMPFFLLYGISCNGTAASVDNNLAYDLVSARGILRADGSSCADGPQTSYYFPNGPPALDPATHAMLAPGRLEADTPALAKQLVRRAKLAEQEGFSGRWHFNRSWASYLDSETAYYSAHAAFLDGEACLPAMVSEQGSNYNETTCTTTFTQSQIPSPAIPLVDAASVYLGSYQNNGFGGWSNFTKWRVNTNCDPGSPNAPNYAWDPTTGEAIPGGCVGVLPGFIGNQFGSFTCDKARLAPTGWQGFTASPVQIPGVDVTVARTGTHSLRFGNVDEVPNPLPAAAKQRYGIEIEGLVPNTATVFEQATASFWVQTSGLSTTRLQVAVIMRFSDKTSSTVRCSPALLLPNDTAGNWSALSCLIDNTGETREFSALSFQLSANDFTGQFYIDDITLTIPTPNGLPSEDLLANSNGSFEEGQRDASSFGNNGNWCTGWNSLLGATAVFGSVSHWMTKGWSHRQVSTLAGLLSPRLLGEVVWGSQNSLGSAVLIGDPIYEPPLALEIEVEVEQGLVDDTTPLTVNIRGSVRNGRRAKNWNAVRYTLSYAEGTDPSTITTWLTTGIDETNTGMGGHDGDVLGSWDTGQLSSGDYMVRIVAQLPWGAGTNDMVAYTSVSVNRRCVPNPCTEAGRTTCFKADEELVLCQCDEGFVEDDEGSCISDPCTPDPCSLPNSSCVDGVGSCVCDIGFTEMEGACVADVCANNPCTIPLRSVCTNNQGVAQCGCDEGRIENAEGRCVRDSCTPNPCTVPRQTRCVNDNGNAICLCDAGYQYDGSDVCVKAAAPATQSIPVQGCGCSGSGTDGTLLFILGPFILMRRKRIY